MSGRLSAFQRRKQYRPSIPRKSVSQGSSPVRQIARINRGELFKIPIATVIPKDYWDEKNLQDMGTSSVNSTHIRVLVFGENKIFNPGFFFLQNN